jgi:hypothetical protein
MSFLLYHNVWIMWYLSDYHKVHICSEFIWIFCAFWPRWNWISISYRKQYEIPILTYYS